MVVEKAELVIHFGGSRLLRHGGSGHDIIGAEKFRYVQSC